MFHRHAHQFVALCLSAVVTVAVMAGVDSMTTGQAAPLGMVAAPVAAAQA